MISVQEVTTKKQQREFLDFPLALYKGVPQFVPPLYGDEKKMFTPNYVYKSSCDYICFNAYDEDGTMLGRIQGIIQRDANEKNGERRCRFCRYDAIDSQEVASALFGAVEKWALSQGMDTLVGPLNFSDLEREGMLIGGFDRDATFEENYNFPYYPAHLEALGFQKEVDWTGSLLLGPESPETLQEMEQLVAFIFKRYKLHFGTSKNGSDLLKKYGQGIFDLIDKSYDNLYGTVPFTEGMRKLMMDNFKLIISPKYTAIILDEDNRPVCFGVSFPALGPALKGTSGKFTPVTLIKLLRCIRHPRQLDLGLIGVDPEYLNRGVSAAMSLAIMKMLQDNPRIKCADTNLNLEDNYAIQNQWKRFQREECKRYRSYVKSLTV